MRRPGEPAPCSSARVAAGRRLALGASLLVASFAAGCGADAPQPAPTKPSRDYSSEAKTTIDEKNMDTELKKLETEIDADSK